MNGRERGFLLLSSHLGDPQRKVLTAPQLRTLAKTVTQAQSKQQNGEVGEQDLIRIGINRPAAQRIVQLLSEEERLDWYLQTGAQAGCAAITRVTEHYPGRLRMRLGLDSPGCLWMKGDVGLLKRPCIALVGSRELRKENLEFAKEAGKQAALQGYVLVSGNARGADTAAQEACLAHGGCVISVVADRLKDQPLRKRVLYLSEDGYDLGFSPQRALSRNRVIHALADATLVAQCTLGKGGTWDGTMRNLKEGWSPVFCFDDGSAAARELTQMGAQPISLPQLQTLPDLKKEYNLFDQ